MRLLCDIISFQAHLSSAPFRKSLLYRIFKRLPGGSMLQESARLYVNSLILGSMFFFFSGCITSHRSVAKPVSGFELNETVVDFAKKNLPVSEGYSEVHGVFDPRMGVLIHAKYAHRISPMNQDERFLQDLKRNENLAKAFSSLPYLKDSHRIVVALDTPIVDQVRVWSVQFLREDASHLRDTSDISRKLYLYNGIEKNEGGYPRWSEITDHMDDRVLDLKKRGYAATAFFLPLFGPVIFIDEPVKRMDRVFMRGFHEKSREGNLPFGKLSPGMLLIIGSEDSRMIVFQDFSQSVGKGLYPLFYKKEDMQ